MKLSICFTVDSVEFTKAVIDGTESLGGSESACLGLARALKLRGHDVHIFTTKLGDDAPRFDDAGVEWHSIERLQGWATFKDWDVAIALRQPQYLTAIPAKFRVLWCQDLMSHDAMKNWVMSHAWAYDAIAYVSNYHRHQWEGWLPELKPIGWATKNGHDALLAKAARDLTTKKPNQIIHISRPERGLLPILTMWPALKAAHPDATLALCRYSSMYDSQGWGEVCKSFDNDVAALNAEVGGITYLGELGKPALYKAIAESAVMWYPGVSTFAETSCIAAIEAQACGTPFVGSYKGALPETCPSGWFVKGNAETDTDYHNESIANVIDLLTQCKHNAYTYRQMVREGVNHVQSYTYDAIAAEWETWLMASFKHRYETDKAGILRRLDYDDDLMTAKIVAAELDTKEAVEVSLLADRVAAGLEHTATHYAQFALDTTFEVDAKPVRHTHTVEKFTGCTRILDLACGNGAFAIMLAQADPKRTVVAVDFSDGNIAKAKAAAEHYGVASQIEWHAAPAWDMDTQQPSDWLTAVPDASFDGVFCGEFIEHVANATALVDEIGRVATHMGRVVITCPMGPLGRLTSRFDTPYRSHVHRFRPADLDAIFGHKNAYVRLVLPWQSTTGRGEPVGNWLISYRNDGETGVKPVERRILLRPYRPITAGIITNNTVELRKCLDAIYYAVDEIVLGDCIPDGQPNDLAQIAAEFPRKTKIVKIGDVRELRGGFSAARNITLEEASGEWFFWIDTDETLCGANDLGKYLDGPLYHGYIVPQNHLYLDRPMTTDTPVRIFRKNQPIQFYGCVHEQPQMYDANGDIEPTLQLADVQIAHTGYLYEGVRRDKCVNRNLPLLIRDQEVFADRMLGKLLVMRDHANLGLWAMEAAKGYVNADAKHHFAQVITFFEEYFSDPASKFYPIALPFYQQALSHVNGAIEVEIGVAGKVNGLQKNHAIPERVWARTVPQLRSLLHARIDQMCDGINPDTSLDVEPLPATAVYSRSLVGSALPEAEGVAYV